MASEQNEGGLERHSEPTARFGSSCADQEQSKKNKLVVGASKMACKKLSCEERSHRPGHQGRDALTEGCETSKLVLMASEAPLTGSSFEESSQCLMLIVAALR